MALDLPADYFAEAFAAPNCTIRLIHYPLHDCAEMAESRRNTGVFAYFHVSLQPDTNISVSAGFDTTRHD
jgi:isopenicillin N synthase-like dioxygenase